MGVHQAGQASAAGLVAMAAASGASGVRVVDSAVLAKKAAESVVAVTLEVPVMVEELKEAASCM